MSVIPVAEGNKVGIPRIEAKNTVLNDESNLSLFHGQNELKSKIGVLLPSTAVGGKLPDPWDKSGCISEDYMANGCSYAEATTNAVGPKTKKVVTTFGVKDSSQFAEYFDSFTDADKALRQIHASHAQSGTPDSDLKSLARNFTGETLISAIECKAIINMPSTGRDVVGKSVLALTQFRQGEKTYRRLYILMVSVTS